MIEKFRKASESWIVRGFFLFMAVAFTIMWGGGDLVGRMGSGRQTIATVGRHTITTWEFSEALKRQLQQIQLRTGQNIDDNQAREMGLYHMVRDQLIEESLLEQEAERLGIYVSDDYVRTIIRSDDTFRGEDGKFDRKKFEFLVGKVGYSEAGYVEMLRRALVRERLVDGVTANINIPAVFALPAWRWQHEQRQIETISIPSWSIEVTEKPSDEQLRSFFREHEQDFKAPEFRTVTAIILDQGKIAERLKPTITDEEINAAREARQAEFEGKTADQIKAQIIDDLSRMRASEELQNRITVVEDALGAGETIKEIAEKHQLETKTLTRVDARGQADIFAPEGKVSTAESLSELDFAILKEAFTLDAESSGAPAEAGEGSYFIVHVDEVIPAKVRTWEDVRGKIHTFWIKAEQTRRAYEQGTEILGLIDKGTSPGAAAGKFKLQTVGARISRQGPVAPSVLRIPGEGIENIFGTPRGKGTMFVSDRNQKGLEIMVAFVKTINRPEAGSAEEDVGKMRERLRNLYLNDIVSQYLVSLRKQFPVEINKRFFAKG